MIDFDSIRTFLADITLGFTITITAFYLFRTRSEVKILRKECEILQAENKNLKEYLQTFKEIAQSFNETNKTVAQANQQILWLIFPNLKPPK